MKREWFTTVIRFGPVEAVALLALCGAALFLGKDVTALAAFSVFSVYLGSLALDLTARAILRLKKSDDEPD